MKILFITGSFPPSTDSFADTGKIMVDIFEQRNINVQVMANIDWSMSKWLKILRMVRNSDVEVIQMQYPGMGYKFSLTPQLVALFNHSKTVVTIHEVSQVHFLRKLMLIPFSLCKRIAFTNTFERDYYCKIYPWVRKHNTRILRIGSNISPKINKGFPLRNFNNIIHFGQIRPKKGIEEVITLAKKIKEKNLPFLVTIMGRTYDRFQSYLEEVRMQAAGLPIEWRLNASEEEVSEILGSNAIAYLPYPDGASERRGSLFASLLHEMIVFTTKGDQTPKELNECVKYLDLPENLIDILNQDNVEKQILALHAAMVPHIRTFLHNYSWDIIIDRSIEVYNEMIAS